MDAQRQRAPAGECDLGVSHAGVLCVQDPRHSYLDPWRLKSSKTHGDKVSMDAQALRKRLGRASGEAAQALLGSLLFYVLDRTEGPLRAKDGEHRASHPALLPEASRRPTRFQLLQAKFMGRGREPPLKRREVGRLIPKDRQGPGRSFVNATINKLLEKAQGSASSPSQRPAAREKPRWGGPGGKGTVKTILKKFLAAEEKEAKEKDTREQPPSLRPGASRGPPPRVGGRSTILSKLRERFEQSGCLHAEARMLPLRKEDRRSRALQRRMHRPEVRMLHTATMATSCTRMPPAHFLACTAEPLPALSIATVVGSPRSWLSRCAKISHLDARRQAKVEASLSPRVRHTEPGGNKTPGVELLSRNPREQSSVPKAMAPGAPHMALSTAGGPQPEFSCASLEDRALNGDAPTVAMLDPASPGGAEPAARDRIVGSRAAGEADRIWGEGEGTGEGPQVTMTVCSSEDEAESVLPASEKEPLFAIQRWLPTLQQGAEAHVPPAPSGVRAEQRTQPGMVSPQITVQLPVILEMPAPPVPQPSTLSYEAWYPQGSQGEAVMDRVAAGNPDNRDAPALGKLSRPGQVPESSLSSGLGPQGALKDAAGLDSSAPQTVLTPKPPSSPSGKRDSCSHPGPSGPAISVHNGETQLLTESNETQTPHKTSSSHHPPAWESRLAGSSHPTPACLPGSGPQERGSLLAAPQGCRQLEICPSVDQSIHCGQEERPGLPTEPAPPLGMAPGNSSHDLGKNKVSWLGGQPKTGIPASRETAIAGNVPDPTVPRSGAQKTPQVSAQMVPQAGTQVLKNKAAEPATLGEEGGRAPPMHPCATAGKGLPQERAPSGPSMHRVGATEGGVRGPAWVPPIVHLEYATNPGRPLTVSRPCAPNRSGASSPHVSTENKDVHAMEGDTLCNSMTSRTPTARRSQESPGCDLGQPRWPSTEAQAWDPQPQPRTVRLPTHPTGPAPTKEAWPDQQALELPTPGQQAEPSAVPKVKSSGPAPAGMGPPESHCGPVYSQQTGQQDSLQTMATPLGQEARRCKPEPWAAQDLAGSEKPATREKPGTVRTKDQEHPPGPRVRQVGSPAQEDGTQAVGSPAAQDQGQAKRTVPQARGQPGNTAKGAPIAGTSRDPSVPAPSLGSPGKTGTRRPSQGDKSAATCLPEPTDSPTPATPDVWSHQAPQAQAQAGAPDTPGAERDQPDCERRRRLVHFTKYKAQSFSDQRAFDLSFRSVILRASDTLEAPK
ncbi:PREDICTED: collagen alpha-1(II) chain [Chinchilla lanigera]|uniref:collagen alpha-1(II) chain n=1 Tax=Chinchilla lanigera TaxID=34839 RepID=UPI00038EAB18|nr:PREDICTED: collagen alpha-1(II) chain [Chinchilla lanigera]